MTIQQTLPAVVWNEHKSESTRTFRTVEATSALSTEVSSGQARCRAVCAGRAGLTLTDQRQAPDIIVLALCGDGQDKESYDGMVGLSSVWE